MGVLHYFDPSVETVIQTDASQKGLGAVLLQQGQLVCYASNALTDTEKNDSNIEREMLGVVWGLERFNSFLENIVQLTLIISLSIQFLRKACLVTHPDCTDF